MSQPDNAFSPSPADGADQAKDQTAVMWQLCQDLYPLARSLTGSGVRQSLDILAAALASDDAGRPARLQRFSVPSGSTVFDWTVPREWHVNHARLIGPDGSVVVDFALNNLHLMGYSTPVQAELSLPALQAHLHSLPAHPDWIPYRTSYYADNWGFCLTERQRRTLPEGNYRVDIDTRLFEGQMDWAECFIPGQCDEEILISTHICHPSLANDNLSGIAVAAGLIRSLAQSKPRLGYRFVFVPATIGAIAWLAANEYRLPLIRHALVLSNLGDSGSFHYKASPAGDATIDQVFEHLHASEPGFEDLEMMAFSPYGYDERQYNSPGVALNAGSLMRTPFGQYPQYHTSADDLSFIRSDALRESHQLCLHAFQALQANQTYRSLSPMGEPQLGRRGLYQAIGGNNQGQQRQLAMLWMLNQADGTHSVLDVARRAGLSCRVLAGVSEELVQAGLLEPVQSRSFMNTASVTPETSEEIARLQRRAHELIPGGCHTAAKGDDQFPVDAPPFIVRGKGCHIWDLAGNEYIEYAMGMRAVTLGHAIQRVNEAACAQIALGNNFNRPSSLEVACAERFLELVPSAEMVKFTKDGSTVMTAAVKLARAYTGRPFVAMCSSSPFLSYDDWFIGATAIDAGIPPVNKSLSLQFDYNDIASLERLFDQYPDQIACVAMEPARAVEPEPGYLQQVQKLCNRHGTVFLLDETITGFRWHKHGAQHLYGVTPDLSCFGKAMGNGFSISALAGKRELMRLGGLTHTDRERVFLLSTTHGAESASLGAATEVMRIYQEEPVVEHLHRAGERLRDGVEKITSQMGLQDHFKLSGRGCSLMFATLDHEGRPSQSIRTLFLQQMIRRGVLATSFMTSYSHSDEDIDRTVAAVGASLEVYRQAIERQSTDGLLVGRPSDIVYRKFNSASVTDKA